MKTRKSPVAPGRHGGAESHLLFLPAWPCPSSSPPPASFQGHRPPPSHLSNFCFPNTSLHNKTEAFPRCTAVLEPWGDTGQGCLQLGHEAGSGRGPFPASHIPRQELHRVWTEGGPGASRAGASGAEAHLSVGPQHFLPLSCLPGFQEGLGGRELCGWGAVCSAKALLEGPSASGLQANGRLDLQKAVNQKSTWGWRV